MEDLLTLEELNAGVAEGREYLVIDKKDNLAVVLDRQELMKHGEGKIKRIYQIEGDKFKLVDLEAITHEVIDLVSAKVKVRDLVKEIVQTTPPDLLLEAFRRLQFPKIKAKAKATKGCYGIAIPGTRGKKPIELVIRA